MILPILPFDRYVRDGFVEKYIKDGIEKIMKNWYDLGYEEGDISQRDHTAGLFVIAYGNFCGYADKNIEAIKAKFSTTYTTSLSREELINLLRR